MAAEGRCCLLPGAMASVATILFRGSFRRIGRKGVMIAGGLAFLAGALLQACAQDMAMLIVGRLCLGVGIGLANQVQFYLSWPPPVSRMSLHIFSHPQSRVVLVHTSQYAFFRMH